MSETKSEPCLFGVEESGKVVCTCFKKKGSPCTQCKDDFLPLKFMDAYFSAKAEARVGCAIYLDEVGKRVWVSEVTAVGGKPCSLWDDLVFVGKVRAFCIESSRNLGDGGPLTGPEEEEE